MRIFSSYFWVFALLLTACGYHLRGSNDLPSGIKAVYLEGGSSAFREQFASVIQSSSGKLVNSADQADLIFHVYNDDIQRLVMSLSERGRSNDIELAGHLEYEILHPKKGLLVDKQPINFRREYFNDQQDIIAKNNEETLIKNEMYKQVVRTILSRGSMALEAAGK